MQGDRGQIFQEQGISRHWPPLLHLHIKALALIQGRQTRNRQDTQRFFLLDDEQTLLRAIPRHPFETTVAIEIDPQFETRTLRQIDQSLPCAKTNVVQLLPALIGKNEIIVTHMADAFKIFRPDNRDPPEKTPPRIQFDDLRGMVDDRKQGAALPVEGQPGHIRRYALNRPCFDANPVIG